MSMALDIQQQGQVVFDQQGQLDKIVESLMPGEQVLAVYDAIGAGTGFIGVTDKRVIIQDNSYVGKKIALVSIPFSRISSVSVLSNKSMFGSFFSSSQVAVNTGSTRPRWRQLGRSWATWTCVALITCGIPSPPGWKTRPSLPGSSMS